MSHKFLLLGLAALAASGMKAQSEFQLINEAPANPDNEPVAVQPVPTERQILWNETEFYAFFHYGMNTFTNQEWGNGNESESIYAPTQKPDPEQWLTAVKAAGMKGGIAVVKHHDGFCLWPTTTTTHNITKAGNANGREANIPELFGKAAQRLGMKYGFYISPWDRNSLYYGEDNYVTDVFLKQCEELAQYGDDQFEMWFDGANGGHGYYGGRNTTVNVDKSIYYDVPNLRDRVHKICKNCVLWGVGGEARWIGNEQGYAGETNWAMLELDAGNNVKPTGQEEGWQWNPGESDAKATTAGWFWHSNEDVLSAERLFQMYLETVGRNATLILNCPPDKSGRLPAATVDRLAELGQMMQTRLGTDLAKTATVTASEVRTAGAARTYAATNLTDGDKDTYWATNDGTNSATIEFTWDTPQDIRYILLQEPIRLGQRVKKFKVEYTTDGSSWKKLGGAVQTTTVGYKRILPLNGNTSNSYSKSYSAKAVRVTIEDSRSCPALHTISIY